MKEWICRELSTSTGNSENGVLMREKELIRCKDCKFNGAFGQCEYLEYVADYCSRAERKEE